MGSNWKRVEYKQQGSYGSVEDCTLYIESSRITDVTSYYRDPQKKAHRL